MTALRSLRTALFLAGRAITRGPLGVLLMTVLMMSLVYVQLLFIPSLIQGAIDQAENQLIDTATSSIQVTPGGAAPVIDDAAAFAEQAAAVPGVVAVSSTLRVGSEVSYGSRSGSWPVLAVDAQSYAAVFTTPENLVEGTWLTPGDAHSIVLGVGIAGADLAELSAYRLSLRSVHAGDVVTVTLANGSEADFTVAGIYRNHFLPSDSQAFITDAAVAELAPAGVGKATTIYVRVDHRGDEDTVVAALAGLGRDVVYETWQDQRHAIDEQVKSFDLIKQILRVVSLLIAVVTVVIVTYVDLVGKRRTIGIQRAIGIRSTVIVTSYLVKAVAYAILGVVVGAALFLAVVVPVIDRHPFSFPMGEVSLSVSRHQLRTDAIVLTAVAVAAALLPAWRSVRIRILDAIWR